MGILLFFLTGYVLLSIGLFFLFKKSGRPAWMGLVPGLNFVIWSQMVGRPGWWAALLLIPIVNIFIYAGLCVDMVRSFRKYTFWHSALSVVFGPVYFIYLGLNKDEAYDGPTLVREKEYRAQIEEAKEKNNTRLLKKLQANNPYHKSATREWAEAIIFAVFAAAFIRMFLIEAYVIPTSSMEGSLLVGDFLFVSKAHYGIRTPQTILMLPLLHNRVPIIGGESYLENPQLPYYRFPALEEINRNDPVVFNYPEGDSVYIFPARTWSIHDYRRGAVQPPYRQMIKSGQAQLVTRPMDKKDHYIKRCIALPGDSLEIRNRQVYINGAAAEKPQYLQYMYLVSYPEGMINTRNFSDWGISNEDIINQSSTSMFVILSDAQKEKVQNMDPSITIEQVDMGKLENNPGRFFPHDPANFPDWNYDNYGPIYIPKKGKTVSITPENVALYRRIIEAYEGNELAVQDGQIYINGEAADSYTFAMDYYWMMGDNRHNSEDSRIWGFVPENHIVGKPLFIWFSTKEGSIANGIRWKRIFSSADKR